LKLAFFILDSKIYVWHREHADLIETLSGHKGAVNSVNWSPVNPYMFASAGDDNTIRMYVFFCLIVYIFQNGIKFL
jgi:WD40 repeat protein